MLTVAVLGADGAGKSTVTARLERELRYPVRRIYLGVGAESATHPLPTTRVVRRLRLAAGKPAGRPGPPPLRPAEPGPATAAGSNRAARPSVTRGLGAAGKVANRMAEEAYQEAVCRWHLSCGRILLFDRFYLADYHAHDLAGLPGLPRSRRVHAAFLRRVFPTPDLVLVLDADAQVLHDRKPEGTVEELAQRRQEYLDYARTVPHAVIIDVTQPLDVVVAHAVAAIDDAVDRASAPLAPRRAHAGATR